MVFALGRSPRSIVNWCLAKSQMVFGQSSIGLWSIVNWCLAKSQMMFDKISNLKWQMSFAQNFKSQMANGKWQMANGLWSIFNWSLVSDEVLGK